MRPKTKDRVLTCLKKSGYWIKLVCFWLHICQVTAKTLAEQQEQLKRLEMISSLQETNKMLKVDRDKLEQELLQAQAKVKSRHLFIMCHAFIKFHSYSNIYIIFIDDPLTDWCFACFKCEDPSSLCLCKVTKLQTDISPLHNSLSILSEKNGSLQADKRLLEEDLKRLKARIQVCMRKSIVMLDIIR